MQTVVAAKILIVDDEPQIVQYVRALLIDFGYTPQFITKPQYLFQLLEKETIDLILMDINMPGTDGLVLLDQLKKKIEYAGIPVIMLTADQREELLTQCFEKGATDFIVKPINEIALKSRIQAALTTKAYEMELEKQVEDRTAQLVDSLNELERVNKMFQLFVPTSFINRISTRSFVAGELIKEKLTILFLDIRGYTSFSEHTDPQEVFHFLNRFF